MSMQSACRAWAAAAAAAVLLCLSPAWADGILRPVVKVYSGDAIKVKGMKPGDENVKVRYIGIDAPERGKHFYTMCTDANKKLVEKKKVVIRTDAVIIDFLDRLLGYVYVDDLFVNAELVKNGYALVAPPDGNYRHRELLLSLQQEARANKRGLWAFEDLSDESYYVGSKSKKVFHRPSCYRVKGLAFEDRLIFRTKGEALAGGYSQDWRCCPLFVEPK